MSYSPTSETKLSELSREHAATLLETKKYRAKRLQLIAELNEVETQIGKSALICVEQITNIKAFHAVRKAKDSIVKDEGCESTESVPTPVSSSSGMMHRAYLDCIDELTNPLGRPVATGDPVSTIAVQESTPVASLKRARQNPDSGAKYLLHFDGASKGNPGQSSGGWCLSKFPSGMFVAMGSKYIGPKQTVNEAEYAGLTEGLTYVLNKLGAFSSLEVMGDSNLIVNQVFGTWKCNAANLLPLRASARVLVEKLRKRGSIRWKHIPRELNNIADLIAGQAIKKKRSMEMTFDDTVDDVEDVMKSNAKRMEQFTSH